MKFKSEIKNLIAKRQKWINSSKENNFDSSIFKLLTDLYPDEAHFIYEMLQNAEDAGNRTGITSNTVTFDLHPKKLIFSHQGAPFEIEDIESITGIGGSTKKDDVVKIGKFGIGFKSVFAYTDTPIIKDCNVSFKIQDLLVPIGLENAYDKNTQEVHFEIPFNHTLESMNPTVKSPEKCYAEIEKFLKAFTGIELLFLKNINCMSVKYGDCAVEFIKTYNKKTHIATIHKKDIHTGKTEQQQWLAFYQDIPEYKGLYTSFAFELENEKLKQIDGKLFIYFPADKETTKLKFHMHAPFAPTVARDSIKYAHEENIKIRDALAEHFKNVIVKLSELRYLDKINAFSIFPNKDSNVSEFYKPLYESVIETMKNKPIIPTENGKNESVKNIVRIQDRKFKGLFSSPKAREFLFDGNAYCQEPSTQEDAYTLLGEIISPKQDDELESIINTKFDTQAEYIKDQSNEWIVDFYKYLADKKFTNVGYILKDKQGKFHKQEESKSATLYDTDFCPDLLNACKKKMGDETMSNLKKLGVWELDAKEKLRLLQEEHKKFLGKELTEVYDNLPLKQARQKYNQEFNSLYKENMTKDIPLLGENYIFYKQSVLCAEKLRPFINEHNNLYIIHDIYKNERLNIIKNIEIIQETKKGGNISAKHPAYYKASGYYTTHTAYSSDYMFNIHIDFNNIDFEKSIKLWMLLNQYKEWNNATDAKLQKNESNPFAYAESTVKTQLNTEWLFDKHMNLVSPKNIYFDDLHSDYKLIGTCNLCDILDFKNREEHLDKEWKNLSKAEKEELLQWKKQKQQQESNEPILKSTPLSNGTQISRPRGTRKSGVSKNTDYTKNQETRSKIADEAINNAIRYYENIDSFVEYKDVRSESCGWDLTIYLENNQQYYVEVKGRSADAEISLTDIQYESMQKHKDKYRLYLNTPSGYAIFAYNNQTQKWESEQTDHTLQIESKQSWILTTV